MFGLERRAVLHVAFLLKCDNARMGPSTAYVSYSRGHFDAKLTFFSRHSGRGPVQSEPVQTSEDRGPDHHLLTLDRTGLGPKVQSGSAVHGPD